MTKFRRLSLTELKEVEPQFVRFLSVHGYDADSWEKMKIANPDGADALILQFSQTVFAGVIEKVEYLLHRRPRDLRAYRCLSDKIEMYGLLVEGETGLDLSDPNVSPTQMMELVKNDGATVKLFSGERAYREIGRDQDIFLLMEQGALISDNTLFSLLAGLNQ